MMLGRIASINTDDVSTAGIVTSISFPLLSLIVPEVRLTALKSIPSASSIPAIGVYLKRSVFVPEPEI